MSGWPPTPACSPPAGPSAWKSWLRGVRTAGGNRALPSWAPSHAYTRARAVHVTTDMGRTPVLLDSNHPPPTSQFSTEFGGWPTRSVPSSVCGQSRTHTHRPAAPACALCALLPAGPSLGTLGASVCLGDSHNLSPPCSFSLSPWSLFPFPLLSSLRSLSSLPPLL